MRGGSKKRASGYAPFWVAFSEELDDTFAREFAHSAPADARLLVLDEGGSADRLLSRLVTLQIRSTERFYVADCTGLQKTKGTAALLQRLASALSGAGQQDRILDAKLDQGMLRVVSAEFKRLDVPVHKIAALANASVPKLGDFEIDEDGSFVYWPKLDVHLGWEELEQLLDPEKAHKARQKDRAFNIRYGKAVRKVREAGGVKPGAIRRMSAKQLRRIEAGECRLTANGIQALSEAHGLEPNDYLRKLAEALPAVPN